MDGARLTQKRWRKELRRRRLKKERIAYLGVKGHSIAGWDALRRTWRERKKRIRAEQKKHFKKGT